jgi:predicted nuclease with TOPRIM domain
MNIELEFRNACDDETKSIKNIIENEFHELRNNVDLLKEHLDKIVKRSINIRLERESLDDNYKNLYDKYTKIIDKYFAVIEKDIIFYKIYQKLKENIEDNQNSIDVANNVNLKFLLNCIDYCNPINDDYSNLNEFNVDCLKYYLKEIVPIIKQ